jgi:tetratricopeptide (TPR) repeat protein
MRWNPALRATTRQGSGVGGQGSANPCSRSPIPDPRSPARRPFWIGVIVFALLGLLLLPSGWASSARLNRAALALDHAQLYPASSPEDRRAQVEQVLPELKSLASLTDAPNLRPGAVARRLGMAYLALGQTEEARAAFRGDPQAAAYLFSQGMMHVGGLGQSEAILAFYRMATEIDPMTDLIYCRMAGGLDEEDAENAVFISDKPTAPPSPELLARCHERLGQKFIEGNQWSEATVEFQRAAELVPGSAAYQQQLGWTIYRARGDLSQAALALQRAAELDPTSMWPCLMLSQLRREQGLLEEAIAWADVAMERAPGNPTPLVYRAQALVEAGQYSQAETTLQAALEINSRLGAAYFSLGTIRWRTGAQTAAIADYERAVELEPNNIGYRLGLGDAYLARGRRAEAVAAYEAVLRIDKNNAAAQEKLAALRER